MNADYNAIRKFCGRLRAAYIAATVLNSWFLSLALLSGAGALLSVSFFFFPWTALPVLFDAAVIITVLVCAGIAVRRACIRPPSEHAVAQKAEALVPRKHHYLSIALQLYPQASDASLPLVQQVCMVARRELDRYPKRIPGVIQKKRVAALCLSLTLFMGAAFLLRPAMLGWWDMPFSLFGSQDAALYPGKTLVAQNTRLVLKCTPRKAVYPSARLHITDLKQFGGRAMRVLLRPDSAGIFTFRTDPLHTSIAYAFSLGSREFGPDTITVVPPPVLYSLKVVLTPPPYTGLKKKQQPEGLGSIAAYAGTRAQFTISSVFPLFRALFIKDTTDTIPFAVTDGKAHGETVLWNPGAYTFFLQDSLLQPSDSLPSFYISILPDYGPNVRILKPAMNKMLSPAQQETLWVEAADDFGIRSLLLHWTRSGDDIDTVYTRNIAPAETRENSIRSRIVWDLTPLSLYPGDTVFYWAYTRDNKPFGAPQICVSDTFFFRVPTFEEIHRRVADKQDDAGKSLSSVQKLQQDAQERLKSLIKSAEGKESLSWEEKKIMEDLGKSIQQQSDSLQKAVKDLEEAVEKMKESAVSSEILEKMDEVQKALKELVEKYGDSLFFKPPQAEENIGWKDIRDAVEKMKEMMPDLKESLDNTLKFLEMLKKENERAMLAQQAQKLAEEQMQISASSEPEEKQKQMESDLLERTGDFLDEVRKALSDENSPVGLNDVPSHKQAAAQQSAMKSDLAMQRMPQKNAMNNMAANLQSLSGELESTLLSALAAKAMQDRQTLLAMAQDVMDLSQWQNELADSAGPQADSDKKKKMTAAEQQALRDALRKSMNRIDSLQVVPPALLQKLVAGQNAALSAMKGALESLEGSMPGSGMKGSAYSLNELANDLLDLASAMSQNEGGGQGGAGGMMSGLRKLSAKQAAINSLTGEMLKQMFSSQPGQGGEGKQQGESDQMGRDGTNARQAAQKAQEQLADQLKQLQDQYGGTGDKSLSSRVAELEEEARRIAEMLKQPTPDVNERQDRFLVRMLQTALSMHREDEGKEERQSTSAATVFSDDAIDQNGVPYNAIDTYYMIRMKALEGNYPDSYRKEIQAYFDMLGELFLKEK